MCKQIGFSWKLDLPKIIKFDIPPPPANRFDAYMPSGKVSIPLEQIREFMMPGCAYCPDMTSEFTDISVGSVEGLDGWNTVIVRTERGAELIETARGKGKLETNTISPRKLTHLKEASRLKKKRAFNEMIKKGGDKRDLRYLGLSEKIVDKILS